jgi:hypothetical protein
LNRPSGVEDVKSDYPKVPGTREAAKKPYVKPAFRHEKVFETMALACGKIAGTQQTCRANRKNS